MKYPQHKCPHCDSKFRAPRDSVKEHDGCCPACWDLAQVLAFANSVGAPLTMERTVEVIRNICLTRLGEKQ